MVGAARADGLPPPAHTIYKCSIQGTTVYSDDPCPKAERLDIVPNSGINHLSGHKREGADVRHENTRRELGRALRPLTGMDDQQFSTATRRTHLTAPARQRCQRLDQSLPELENMQAHAAGRQLENIQQQLLQQRTEFRRLNC